ncbi:unnamed protein product [Rotaria sp. Silwood2]|nr:unnamed protein product [Rotaria sp. Silwood2]CAF3194479.1 unnamed protein product [Rotaria sp. Silwood2]CAF4564051.1 unnamed protein product [Rotaria sp. Silwood2]CAF4573369.1 unnamed protein product [Rotaria sp. Silwood2]
MTGKKSMRQQCQLEYSTNAKQPEYIHNFEKNCVNDDAINWYTKDSFVHRLVNEAFCKRNIDLICKFRYVIILIYNQLKKLSRQQQKENHSTVYRGQILGKRDLESLQSNIGYLISVNSSMSTSLNKKVAHAFIHGAETGVIFEIDLLKGNNNDLHPFADISQLSAYSGEKEILFFPGAVFCVDSVEKENDSIWIVKLIRHNDTAEQMKQFMDVFKNQLNLVTCWDHLFMKVDDMKMFRKNFTMLIGRSFHWKDLLTEKVGINVYYLASILGNYEKVIEYLKDLLYDESFINDSKAVIINIIIGYNYFHLFKFDDALFHYEIALSSLDSNHNLREKIYIHIGDVWQAKGDVETALSYYKQVLERMMNHDADRYDFAILCRKIYDIYVRQGNYEDAIIYEEQADTIDENSRQKSEFDAEKSLKYYQDKLNSQSSESPDQQADTLYSIGICLLKKSKYTQALEKLLQAKDILENYLPPQHCLVSKFCTLFDSIALAYLLLKQDFDALIMLKKSIDIRMGYDSK